MNLIDKIKELSLKNFEENLSIRRHIHKNPELSFNEFKTTEFIISHLKKHNIQFVEREAKVGLTAIVKGKNPDKKVIAMKADIDALPVHEKNNIEYKSITDGVMHACGHDYNTTTLLGAAILLNSIKDDFEGTVKLIFQTGEEKLPGGAKQMIEEGVLKNPDATLVIGQHGLPELETGTVGYFSGTYMASTDEVYITVKGKGGHGAMPNNFTDSVLIASHIIVALQQIVSRQAPPMCSTVLSFGKIIGNGSTNIMPDEVKIEGTLRTQNEEWRYKSHEKITKLATELARSMDGDCEVRIAKGYPALYNNPKVTESVRQFAEQYVGKENMIELSARMTSDDFAYFSQALPATYFRTGVGNKSKNITSQLHTATFNIDEEAFKTSVGLMSWLAVSMLKE